MSDFQEGIAKYSVYLEELRRRVFRLTKFFVLIFFVGFFVSSPVIKFLINHLHIPNVIIATTSPFQLINLSMSIGFFFACVITVPILIYSLYSFLKPGLLKKEKRLLTLSVPLAIGLFVLGFFYCSGVLYYGVNMIAQVNVGLGIANYWDISSFISEIVFTSSLLGLLFILPLVITFLIRLKVMSVQFLSSKRKHAVIGIFILVSLLPPTDGLSLIVMAVPLVLIFELTVLFNKRKTIKVV